MRLYEIAILFSKKSHLKKIGYSRNGEDIQIDFFRITVWFYLWSKK